MAQPRIFTPKNRLASIMDGPGGATAEALEHDARQRLRAIQTGLTTYIEGQLKIIEAIAAAPDEIIFAECRALGAAALGICEVAGAAGLDALGDAARGIRAMVEARFDHGVWHAEALKLHIDALVMFSANRGLPTDQVRQVLVRLKAMRDGIGVPE